MSPGATVTYIVNNTLTKVRTLSEEEKLAASLAQIIKSLTLSIALTLRSSEIITEKSTEDSHI